MMFALIMRSMPAMPIAESRPPMVVGIRQTSSATRTVSDAAVPWAAAFAAYTENGSSVAQANRKISVNLASRMDSAISLGVRERLAPSTSAIMRSRKVSPGFAVMRTTSQSDSTRVPPVTAERSPPDSRTTGADSPVMADSSTVAAPSTTSPSPGMTSPAGTYTKSPLRRADPGTFPQDCFLAGSDSFFAITSRRVPRSAAACALPRPSATLSAKFANTMVNQSHSATARTKPELSFPVPASQISVTSRLPTHTTNITGLRHCTRGSSLTKDSSAARCTMELLSVRMWAAISGAPELQMLHDRAERQRGNEGQRAQDQDRADEKADE